MDEDKFRELMEQQNNDARTFLEGEGIEFIEMDRTALREAVQSVYDNNTDLLDPAIIEKINNL